MGRGMTLEQYVNSLIFEKSDIDKLIERRHEKPEHRKRLEEIETRLNNIASMGKLKNGTEG
jgi:tetrahydromethanopterin S-methyltransferase subunit G